LNANIDVQILDVLGKEIQRTTFYTRDIVNVQHFDLSNAAQGIYFIALTIKENNSSPDKHYIKKLNIIQ
jgi:hypothetical protein